MKLVNISFDKENCVIYVDSNIEDKIKGTIVITDLYLDCVYYAWDMMLNKDFNGWYVPFTERLKNIVLNTNTFAGFNVKFYDVNKRLLQSEKVYLNKVPPLVNTHFYSPTHDITGPSYIDFFYGDLCDGIDTTGVVVDAGANVGFFTLYAKEKGAKRVYSIEPDPMPFYYLEKNFEKDPSIILVNKAMNDVCDSLKFDISLDGSVGSTSSIHSKIENKLSIIVQVITIDNIVAIENEINLLKLDIEGSEFAVIDHMTDDCFNKINQMFIEFHYNPKPITDKLISKGYQVEYRHSDENSTVGFIYAKKL
jgi:FkbM family methyltransferase